MGYSPGFLLKSGQISTLANSPGININSRARSWQLLQNGIGGVPESLEGFRGLTKIGHVQKPWAIAQAFCSKTSNFRPLRIHPKSTQTVARAVRNHFRRVQEAFQRVWSEFEDLPKSVMFKTMGYSPGFLLKNGQNSTLANSPEININSRARSWQLIQNGIGGVPESLEGFRGLTKIGHVQNHGLQPRLFAEKRPIFDPCELSPNRHKQRRKELEIILEGYRRRFRELEAISRTYQNRSCSKPWAIVQAFCSKTSNFRPLRIQPKSTQTVAQGVRNYFRRVQEAFPKVWRDFEDLPKSVIFKTMGYSPGFLLKNGQFSTLANCPAIDTNSAASSQKSLQKGIGGVSESLEGFRGLTKISHFQNHELQPRLFAQKRPIFDPCELSRNRHKQWLKELEIILEGYRRRFRKFGGISRTYQNRSFSKPWAIAQAFCSKTSKFRPLRIHPKST